MTRRILLTSSMFLLAACGSDSTAPQPDTQAPTVSISGPPAGAVAGVVSITVNAHDNRKVASVEWKVNGGLVGFVDTTAPYAYDWDTSTYANGTYTWTAVATDGAGNTTESTGRTFTVGL